MRVSGKPAEVRRRWRVHAFGVVLLAVAMAPMSAVPAAADPTTEKVSLSGSNYGALVQRIADRMTVCAEEARRNASRSVGWSFSNPALPPDGQNFTRREATKIVNSGQCQITYLVRERYEGRAGLNDCFCWRVFSVTISATRFDTEPPTPVPPPEKGDKRDQCLPAQAKHYPHLCTDIYGGSSRRVQPDPDSGTESKYKPCHDGSCKPIPAPGWRESPKNKGDRLVENMKRHQAQCRLNPDEPCPPFPFHEWV